MKLKNWIPAFAAIAALLASTAFAAGAERFGKKPDFLPVDQAFELQPLVRRDDATLEVSWRIAKDYYLYRDKLKVSAVAPAALNGPPALPPSLPYEDEHFGTVQIYRDRLAIRLPAAAAKGTRVTVVYQGCADAGLCYPPQTRTLALDD